MRVVLFIAAAVVALIATLLVIAPAQWGQHGGNRASYGHALIIDPWGTVIAECGDHEGFALAPIDLGYQDSVRQRLPCLSHRRLP